MRLEDISTLEYWQNLCTYIIKIDDLHFVELDEVIIELEENGHQLSTNIVADEQTRLLPYTSAINNKDTGDTGFTYFVPVGIILKYLI